MESPRVYDLFTTQWYSDQRSTANSNHQPYFKDYGKRIKIYFEVFKTIYFKIFNTFNTKQKNKHEFE